MVDSLLITGLKSRRRGWTGQPLIITRHDLAIDFHLVEDIRYSERLKYSDEMICLKVGKVSSKHKDRKQAPRSFPPSSLVISPLPGLLISPLRGPYKAES